MRRKGGLTLVILAAALPASAPAASASMQLVPVDQPTSVRTFHALHGINDAAERDEISVVQYGSEIVMDDQAGISSFPADCRRLLSTAVACPIAGYDDVAFFTGPGDDQVTSKFDGPDLTLKQIFGPAVSVYINANLGPGNDSFSGDDGTDAVGGGPGRDHLTGNRGNDLLNGQAGNDVVSGEAGTDFLVGAAGRDRLIAGVGVPDYMVGGKGRDTCIAGEGRDRVAGCERVHF